MRSIQDRIMPTVVFIAHVFAQFSKIQRFYTFNEFLRELLYLNNISVAQSSLCFYDVNIEIMLCMSVLLEITWKKN